MGVRLTLEGGAGGLGHIGGAVHPVGNRRPGIFRYRLDEIVQAFVLADGDGEAHVHPAADGYHAMSIEAAVGPHSEPPAGPGVAHRPTVSRRKWAAPRAVLARPSRSRAISMSPVPAATASQQRVIAPGAGVAVVAGALLGQSIGLADGLVQVMVKGELPGPAPVAHARASNWRLTWSS